MTAPSGAGGRPRVRAADVIAMLWAVLCCWAVVWGNYLLLDLKVRIFWIVPIDMFAVPALVTLVLLPLARRVRGPA